MGSKATTLFHVSIALALSTGPFGLAACEKSDESGHQNTNANSNLTPGPGAHQRIFVPRIVAADGSDEIWRYSQLGTIFWFGRVDSSNNYTDCRLGYNDRFLMARFAVFDQRIYDEATDDLLSDWDSITLLFDLDGETEKTEIDQRSFRIDAQAYRHGIERTVIYQGSQGAWVQSALVPGGSPKEDPDGINLTKAYRGGERDESRGWAVTFYLGFEVLGLSGPPLADGQRTLRVAVVSYDRDNLEGTAGGEPRYWPTPSISPEDPSTWGRWEILDGHFLSRTESGSTQGDYRPAYSIVHQPEPYQEGTEQTIVIRNGLDDEQVTAASVGASEVLCSGNDSYNFGDGTGSWGGNTERSYFHIQNQSDIADWPCFAKIYVKFPLAKLPRDKVVISAHLTLHHKQPTSGGDEGEWSLIQAFSVANTLVDGATDWNDSNLTWNDAPVPFENLAGVWVDRTGNVDVGWDNLPRADWDVTRAVALSADETHMSFALSSADTEYHTGKEFVRSTDFEDWGDQAQRPTLTIIVADPL